MHLSQFTDLKIKMQQMQMKPQNIEEDLQQLEESLNHLLEIKAALEESEEMAITIKLHLLHDPSRFFIARLLDPHGLNYKWPFGGLVFSYEALEKDGFERVEPYHIFIEDAIIVGAGWDESGLCLTECRSNTRIWKIRGTPADIRDLEVPPNFIEVSLFSSRHAGEVIKVPLNAGKEGVEYWERKHVYLNVS